VEVASTDGPLGHYGLLRDMYQWLSIWGGVCGPEERSENDPPVHGDLLAQVSVDQLKYVGNYMVCLTKGSAIVIQP